MQEDIAKINKTSRELELYCKNIMRSNKWVFLFILISWYFIGAILLHATIIVFSLVTLLIIMLSVSLDVIMLVFIKKLYEAKQGAICALFAANYNYSSLKRKLSAMKENIKEETANERDLDKPY